MTGTATSSVTTTATGTAAATTRVLVVDCYDSFVFNLVQYLGQLRAECVVVRSDEVTVDEALAMHPDGILLSPGPGVPERAGIAVDLLAAAAGQIPVLGVCLGHQAIGVAFGGRVVRAPELLHGKTSEVVHEGQGVLAGLPSPFTATRYHSLVVAGEDLPDVLEVTARTASGLVMAMRHRELAVEGVQFHPESVLTQGGHQILANWLAVCGDPDAPSRVPALAEHVETRRLAAVAASAAVPGSAGTSEHAGTPGSAAVPMGSAG